MSLALAFVCGAFVGALFIAGMLADSIDRVLEKLDPPEKKEP